MAKQARARASAWLDRVGLADRASAPCRQLSGGQAQQMRRSPCPGHRPRLLLDEPRPRPRRHPRKVPRPAPPSTTCSGVTCRAIAIRGRLHPGDRSSSSETGRIVQTGTLAEVTARPGRGASPWSASASSTGRARTKRSSHDGGRIVPATVRRATFAVIWPRRLPLYLSRPEGESTKTSGHRRSETSAWRRNSIQCASTGPFPSSPRILRRLSTTYPAERGPGLGVHRAARHHDYPA